MYANRKCPITAVLNIHKEELTILDSDVFASI